MKLLKQIICVRCELKVGPTVQGTYLCRSCLHKVTNEWDKVRHQRAVEMLFEIAEVDCNDCGVRLTLDNWSLDHIVPKAVGGGHERSNLRWWRRRCNSSKGMKLVAVA